MLLHQLNVFITVAEKKSFSRAAEAVYLSQSTISSHINNLEKHFGKKLFDRLGKEIVLTPAGEKLYPLAKEILALQVKAARVLMDTAWNMQGHLQIVASTAPAEYIAPKLIARFSQKYPDVFFTLDSLDSKQVAEKLVKGEADLGILGHQYFPDKLKFIPLTQEKLVLIAPPSFHFNGKLSIHDFTGYPFLFRKLGSGTQATVENLLHKAKVDISKLNVIGYFDSVQIVKQCVKEEMGLSIISEIAASDYVQYQLIQACELDEFTEKRTFYLAYNAARTLSPLVNEFVTTLPL
jgi:LysR family transcriptional regulator, low CO2-responsive transcriptional regulator